MIKFSERQLKAPNYMRPVYVVAAGQTDFRKNYPEKKTEELCVEALRMLALENDLKVDGVQELKRYIHSCFYSHFADHFGDQLLGEALIHDRLGLDPLGNVAVRTGGATGGSTLWVGANAHRLRLLRLLPGYGVGADGRGGYLDRKPIASAACCAARPGRWKFGTETSSPS